MLINQAFWSLLQAGLWQKALPCIDVPLSSIQWDELHRFAKKQTLEGIIFDGMIHLPEEQQPDELLRLKWYGRVNKTEQTHRLLNHVLVEVVSGLEAEDIPSMLLKGQGNASFYLNPLRRHCGDIDLFVGRKNYQKACELMKSWGMEGDESIKHFHGEWHGVHIEIHRVAAYFNSKRKTKQIVEWSERLLEESKTTFIPSYETKPIAIPTPEFNVLFVFYHLFDHFTKSGIGLRQLCDLARMLHVFHQQLDLSLLEKHLHNYELMHPWQVFGYLLVHWLGLTQEEFPFYKDTKEKTERVLKVILNEGNFGYYSGKQKHRFSSYLGRKWESFCSQTNRYLRLMRLFPSWMLGNYVVFVLHGTQVALKGLLNKEKR